MRLAVCAEMVVLDLPVTERARRDCGYRPLTTRIVTHGADQGIVAPAG